MVTVDAGFTTWLSAVDELGAEALSPRYSAVTACVPALNQDRVIVAIPPFKVAEPTPTKCTVPVAGLGPFEVTEVVHVTACPYAEGLTLETGVVVVVGYLVTT